MRYDNRRVSRPARPSIYGRPKPPARRRSLPELKLNWRSLVGLALALGLTIWWWRTFKITNIQVDGARSYPAELVSSATREQLARHWWWKNLLLLDTRGLQKRLLATQPQLTEANISRHWPRTVLLKVTERQPNMTWRTGGKTYLLSGDGVIAAEAGDIGGRLPVVEDTTNLPVKAGDKVVPAKFVSFCLELVGSLPKQGVQITGLKIPESTTEVFVVTNQNYYIKFDTERSASAEVGDLSRVLAQLKSQNKKPTEYVDLRIEGKAYYK
jgi:cell division protein FtsQ